MTAFIPVRLITVPWLIPGWAKAQVWGRFILIRRGVAVTEQLLAHELAHVLQWRLMGIFPFIFYYLKYFLPARLPEPSPGISSPNRRTAGLLPLLGPANPPAYFMIISPPSPPLPIHGPRLSDSQAPVREPNFTEKLPLRHLLSYFSLSSFHNPPRRFCLLLRTQYRI